MSGYNFSVTRVAPGPCAVPGCTSTARNEVRMVFPGEAGPYRVCGHHQRWAKDMAAQSLERRPDGRRRGEVGRDG